MAAGVATLAIEAAEDSDDPRNCLIALLLNQAVVAGSAAITQPPITADGHGAVEATARRHEAQAHGCGRLEAAPASLVGTSMEHSLFVLHVDGLPRTADASQLRSMFGAWAATDGECVAAMHRQLTPQRRTVCAGRWANPDTLRVVSWQPSL